MRLVAQCTEAILCVCDQMEPLMSQQTIVVSSCKNENGEGFTHAGPHHRSSTSSSTDSEWYSASPNEIDPSSIAVTELLLQIQEVTKDHEDGSAGGSTSNEKPLLEHNRVTKSPSNLDIPELRKTLTGRPKLRRICHICGRECPSRHKLQRHLSTHTEDRPYNCKICGKAFKWTEYLSKHMRTQHGNNANPTSKSIIIRTASTTNDRKDLPAASPAPVDSAASGVDIVASGQQVTDKEISKSPTNNNNNMVSSKTNTVTSQQSTPAVEQSNPFSTDYPSQSYSCANYFPFMGQNGYNCMPINCYSFHGTGNQFDYSNMSHPNLSFNNVVPFDGHYSYTNHNNGTGPSSQQFVPSSNNSATEKKCSSQTTEIGTNTSSETISPPKKSTIKIINLSRWKDVGIQCELGPETLEALLLEEDGGMAYSSTPPNVTTIFGYTEEESSNSICKYPCECQGCYKAYVHRKDLVRHMKVAHHSMPKLREPCVVETPVKPYMCPESQCGRSYYHLKDLRRHQRQCHSATVPEGSTGTIDSEDPTLRYPCDFDGCVKSYRHKKDLIRHKRLVHQDTSQLPSIPDPIVIKNGGGEEDRDELSRKRFRLDSSNEPLSANTPDTLPQTPGLGVGDLSTLDSSMMEVVANMVGLEGVDIPLSTIVTLATNAEDTTMSSLVTGSDPSLLSATEDTIPSLISVDYN